jgi:hypothetical protein
MTVKIGAFYVGMIGSKFTYRYFLFPFAERVGFESLRKRKNVEKIMASSAQPTRLSKLSFPRYTTSLATTPRVRPTLALYVLRAARGAHVSVHREPRARHLTSQARRRQPRFRSPRRIH